MIPLRDYSLVFRSRSGVEVGFLTITPIREFGVGVAPLVQIDEMEAREHGETAVQLREAERYEYEVVSSDHADLRLRCKLVSRRKSLKVGMADEGLIETGSFCGTLLMELVEGEVNDTKLAVASGLIDVRSVKLLYRTEYRGMLRRLSDELAGLVADARSSAKINFRSSFEDRTDQGWLQIQLELLRETLDGVDFALALHRIIDFPHERLSMANDIVQTDRPIRWAPSAVRELIRRNPRRAIPPRHSLCALTGMMTIASHVTMPRRSPDNDTPENRFVKFALSQFSAFLSHANKIFRSSAGWGASEALSRRLLETTEDWLGRGFFREVGKMTFAPFGSPVLQRQAGYRELLRWWLRFRSAAELSWGGGEDVFRAGQRDIASLYEYWLFFELLGWFCRKCRDGVRPAIQELVDGLDDDSPNLRLRKQIHLGPFVGEFAGQSRQLNARFSYNRLFPVTSERQRAGSWTRRLRPDYTITFWPEGFSEAEAERNELLVHVHFDAKYRIEDSNALFGADDLCDADDEEEGNYKRQDLLKMHAYRDAIKRSQGAYILYPGRSDNSAIFTGFHEILPGLGAFGIVPNADGSADGTELLERFLDDVMSDLSNRTSARERVGYHLALSYMPHDTLVPYGDLRLPELDVFGSNNRSLPPDEHMVLIAEHQDNARMQLATSDNGLIFVQFGHLSSSPHIHPDLARVRHVAVRTEDDSILSGLLSLREPGFRIFTGAGLHLMLKQDFGTLGIDAWGRTPIRERADHIYAVFQTKSDAAFNASSWNGPFVTGLIEAFELDIRTRMAASPAYSLIGPRIISLRGLLEARISS